MLGFNKDLQLFFSLVNVVFREDNLARLVHLYKVIDPGLPMFNLPHSLSSFIAAKLWPWKHSLPSYLVNCFEVDPGEDIPEERQSPRSRWEVAWLPVFDHIQQK